MKKQERPQRQTPEEVQAEVEQMVNEIEEFEPPIPVQLAIISRKVAEWKNTIYDAKLDAKVALHTDDTRLLQAAQKRLKTALQSVEFLESEVDSLLEEQEEKVDEPVTES